MGLRSRWGGMIVLLGETRGFVRVIGLADMLRDSANGCVHTCPGHRHCTEHVYYVYKLEGQKERYKQEAENDARAERKRKG